MMQKDNNSYSTQEGYEKAPPPMSFWEAAFKTLAIACFIASMVEIGGSIHIAGALFVAGLIFGKFYHTLAKQRTQREQSLSEIKNSLKN